MSSMHGHSRIFSHEPDTRILAAVFEHSRLGSQQESKMSKSIVSSRNVTPLHVLGTQVRFLCEAQDTGNVWSLMEVTLPLGAGPPPHKHAWDEAYFVMGGDVEFTLGEEVFTAKGGDFIYTPGGVVHGFRGVSTEPARVLIFDAPAHAGTF